MSSLLFFRFALDHGRIVLFVFGCTGGLLDTIFKFGNIERVPFEKVPLHLLEHLVIGNKDEF